MVLLNLKPVDVSLDNINQGRKGNITVREAIIESRENHNILVQALNTISKQIEELSNKVDNAPDTRDLCTSVKTLKEDTVPKLREQINKNREVLEAKITEATDKVNLKHEQLEAHGRRLNLIWNGRAEEKVKVPTHQGGHREIEDTEALFRKFAVESLHLNSDYVDSMILRGIHRLPKNPKMRGPPPIIVAFICMKHRNDVLSAARELKDTPFSLKSDLPYGLNKIRSEMLKEKSRLKEEENQIVRLVERNYLPVLQIRNRITNNWSTVMSIGLKGDKNVAIMREVGQPPATRAELLDTSQLVAGEDGEI